MIAKLFTFLVLVAVCLAFPAEDLKVPVAEGAVGQKQPGVAPADPEGPSDLQTDNTFWYGGGYNHHHHYPAYTSYYRPRTYSYYSYYEPYSYHSDWW